MTAMPAWLQRWQQAADDEVLYAPQEQRRLQEVAPGDEWPWGSAFLQWRESLRQMAAERWPADVVEDTAS